MALHNDASGKGTVMPTITVEAIQWMQEEMESVTSERDEVQEELELALEENAALRLENQVLRSDRSFRD